MKKLLSLILLAGMFSAAGVVGMDGVKKKMYNAVDRNDFERAGEIIRKYPEMVNEIVGLGEAPLHIAAGWGNLDMIKYLIEKKAQVNKKNSQGETPLHGAARNGRLEVVKYLIANGANMDIQDNQDETPLHKAVSAVYPDLATIEYLISHGARLDIQDKHGWTALHASVTFNLDALKAIGASFKFNTSHPGQNWRQAQKLLHLLRIKDNEGKTALDIAKERNKQESVAYLMEIQKKAESVKNPALSILQKEQRTDLEFEYKKNH